MLLADPDSLVASVFASVFAARERLDAAAWAERYRRVEGGAINGAWDFSRTPYLRGVCLAYSDPAVRRVTVMKAEQVGGTEAMMNCLMWSADSTPGGTLWVYPNEAVARKVNKERMLPSMRACPRVAARMGHARGDQGTLEIRLNDGSYVYFVGSNSDANIEVFSFRRVFIDELDRCVPGILGKVRGRVKAYPDGTVYDNSTPTDDGAGIHASYLASDRCRWWTPCPDCGHWHVRDDFAQVSWPMEPGKPLSADPGEVRRAAWYACPACEHHITPAEHQATSRRGLWLPAGWEVDAWGQADGRMATPPSGLPAWCVAQIPEGVSVGYVGGKFEGQPLPDEPPPPSAHAGFHICGEMSTIAANPFGEVAGEFVESRGHPGVEWLNRRRGCPWRAAARRVGTAELRRLCVPVALGGYRMGQCPRGTLALTMAADIQAREAFVEVRGWGAGGRQSALVWCERAPIDAEAGEFAGLEAVMRMRFAMRDDPERSLPVGAVFIDSGYFTDQIYAFVARLRARGVANLWPVKGEGTRALAQPIVESRIDLAGRPGVPGASLTLLRFRVNFWKQAALGRIHGEEELVAGLEGGGGLGVLETDAGTLDAAADRRFMLPEDAPDEYLIQLTSEERVVELVAGQPVHVFKTRPGFANRNHWWDACGYNLAGAHRAGVLALREHRPTPAAPPTRPERHGLLARAGRGILDRRTNG